MHFLPRKLKFAAAAAALLAACSPAPEKAADAGGLPMWVIEDNDSTIYMTGTVHMLPPDVQWRSPRLDKALKDSTELWLELPMPTSQEAMLRQYGPMMMKHMMAITRSLKI